MVQGVLGNIILVLFEIYTGFLAVKEFLKLVNFWQRTIIDLRSVDFKGCSVRWMPNNKCVCGLWHTEQTVNMSADFFSAKNILETVTTEWAKKT